MIHDKCGKQLHAPANNTLTKGEGGDVKLRSSEPGATFSPNVSPALWWNPESHLFYLEIVTTYNHVGSAVGTKARQTTKKKKVAPGNILVGLL